MVTPSSPKNRVMTVGCSHRMGFPVPAFSGFFRNLFHASVAATVEDSQAEDIRPLIRQISSAI
jgi:hypothetical protein